MSRRPYRRPGRQQQRPAARFQARVLPEPLAIERLSHDGRGIARWEGKTLFVAGALPGETVTVRLLGEQSRFAEGEVTEVLVPAAQRQTPPCRHYGTCGGCQLQHLAPRSQVAAKQQAVLDQLERQGKVRPKELVPAILSPSEGYRHRARLGVWTEKNGTVTLGFRRKRERTLTPIDACEVLAPALNALLAPLRGWLEGLERRDAVGHIELILSEEGPAMVVRELKALSPRDLQRLGTVGDGALGDRIWRQTTSEGLSDLNGEPCDPRLHYGLPDFELDLAFHPQDFTQVNVEVNRAMVRQAVDWLAPQPGERVLDLFCGMGNFTLPLARSGAWVRGLEGSDAMVGRARENARRHGLEAEFDTANLARGDARLWPKGTPLDAVLLDPPRDGARELMAPLAQLRPRRLVYASCNPATLARDAGELATAGYDLQSLGVLDMFPHTEHVESMALFVRR
ncbi:23S rRNA (uracil(1939)-C(5))-methyltransferase RlmD [Marinimicrobium agarilyticum]|uniref:23S rRNA (uracil(1939)-C(5))-methyltransferase RlmD n=1 Tax=Marinimicrobium agarilyticum TaxID=306546 RepID=UPI0003F68477|nr:23S rRNA (uracil(1939)-C(5))-methyltransferase RlmD [Marinimicrobium agarilyticum]